MWLKEDTTRGDYEDKAVLVNQSTNSTKREKWEIKKENYDKKKEWKKINKHKYGEKNKYGEKKERYEEMKKKKEEKSMKEEFFQ